MGLGVLEDSVLAHVPGTSPQLFYQGVFNIYCEYSRILALGTSDIFEKERPDEQTNVHSNLKFDRSGTTPILLVPQPSDDPNDPLVRCSSPHWSPVHIYGG
jgi:hypothetical protein